MPSWSLALLLAIGAVDLISTAVLHAHGLIVEMNPVMRPLIESSEWLFIAVKGATLVFVWLVCLAYWKTHGKFIQLACYAGCVAYAAIWLGWFLIGSFA